MIYDQLENAAKYRGLSENLDRAIDFLEIIDLEEIQMGKTEIETDNVFCQLMDIDLQLKEEKNFEFHRKYLDIHVAIDNGETVFIGSAQKKSTADYDLATDFGTIDCQNDMAMTMPVGSFLICMLEEPHMPGVRTGVETKIKKLVIKVLA